MLTAQEDALVRVPARIAAAYGVFPLRVESGRLVLAMERPEEVDLLDELALALECPVTGETSPRDTIVEAIRTHYGVGADTLERLISGNTVQVAAESERASIDEASGDASIISFVNQLIVDAYTSRATDVHLEPFENKLRIRYRIDGILFDANIPASVRHFRQAIASRIKIMANLDISERRLPQDGRIQVRIGGQDFDLRVSVIPIAHGESIDIRLLQRSNVMIGMEKIGFSPPVLDALGGMLQKPNGIILLTGPTGSGKTTTLYAFLHKLNTVDRKIITVEDPVEYQIEGICQMQVRPEIGYSFANGLRAMLRHDPDVMMVGEIRDFETAELAIRCALTGHLVFSTLHTNDAAGAIPRLIDIGIEPYLLSSSVESVLAQRLVRRVCVNCATPVRPDPSVIAALGLPPDTPVEGARKGAGCDLCRHSGYYGRAAILEMLVIDDRVRDLIMNKAPGIAIKRAAIENGMTTLRLDGWHKVLAGITTAEEVLRVTQQDQ